MVIDAGHGGIDGGAVSAAGVKESEINLAIARRLNSLAELYGVRTHMTRVDDSSKSAAEGYSEHEDLVRRVEEINSAPNGSWPTRQPAVCSSASTRTAIRLRSPAARRCCTRRTPAGNSSASCVTRI